MDEALFARYDRLLLQSSLDLMADVVYCPRQSCGTAVMVEPDITMGICSACRYAFCTLCKMGYHGLSHCKITAGNVENEHGTKVVLYLTLVAWMCFPFLSSCLLLCCRWIAKPQGRVPVGHTWSSEVYGATLWEEGHPKSSGGVLQQRLAEGELQKLPSLWN